MISGEQFVQEEVVRLEPGMISSPLLLSGNNGCLLRCTQRTDLGYDSYEEVKTASFLKKHRKYFRPL